MTRPTAESLNVWHCTLCGAYNSGGHHACPFCKTPRPGTADTLPPCSSTGTGKDTPGAPKAPRGARLAPYGRCCHTSRAYRSRTEARWAAAHPDWLYEALSVRTVCGVYTLDFLRQDEPGVLRDAVETKGGFIYAKDRIRMKAAVRPLRLLGLVLYVHQWADGKWTVTEVTEG